MPKVPAGALVSEVVLKEAPHPEHERRPRLQDLKRLVFQQWTSAVPAGDIRPVIEDLHTTLMRHLAEQDFSEFGELYLDVAGMESISNAVQHGPVGSTVKITFLTFPTPERRISVLFVENVVPANAQLPDFNDLPNLSEEELGKRSRGWKMIYKVSDGFTIQRLTGNSIVLVMTFLDPRPDSNP